VHRISLLEAWPILILVGVVLLCQGTCLFVHARKHGGRAWFWGFWGLIQFPFPTLTYTILLWWQRRKRN
jgi:uncharacterized membrane protein HdeD (DUF308 family)